MIRRTRSSGTYFRIRRFIERKTGQERYTWAVRIHGVVICRSSRSYRTEKDLLRHIKQVQNLIARVTWRS